MPERRHLPRLRDVWSRNPIYFLTACTAGRRRVLCSQSASAVLIESWQSSLARHGWSVGRYVVMPDHVHFFARPALEAKGLASFMRDWKHWTSSCLGRSLWLDMPLWQAEFFDHVIRSADSYSAKWEYVRQNPVRAGLVREAELWPYAGEIVPLEFRR
ncbi:MAG TPA: transposase [Candidatus Didemnitutus sp.]|nr:transposase [Candidatus Didemnitutus sp.]